MGYPLEGIRVLDFSRVLAGPFASRMLVDLGAEVVKVEPPEGDVTRFWGRKIAGISGYFHQQNLGKRDICLDLTRPEAVDLVRRLAREADVVMENFRPGVMDRLGIGWSVLSADNPRLVMLSVSGFGQGGPESHRAAYAPIIHAESGVIERQARASGQPASELPLSVADTNASLHGLVGLLAALYRREQTGEGDHIDIAMIDSMLATDDHLHAALEPENAEPDPAQRSEVWETAAGPLMISGDLRWIWKQLTTCYGIEDPTPPGATLPQKIEARQQAARAFLKALPTRAKVIEAMDRMNLAYGEVKPSRRAVSESPTLAARDSIVEVPDRAGGTRRVFRSPYRFTRSESGVRGVAPHRGEHNREVLGDWLSLDAAEIIRLEQAGVLQGAEGSAGKG